MKFILPINLFSISLKSWSILFIVGRGGCWLFSLLPNNIECIDGPFELNNLYSGTWSNVFTVLLVGTSFDRISFGEFNVFETDGLFCSWDEDARLLLGG